MEEDDQTFGSSACLGISSNKVGGSYFQTV